MCYIYEIAIDFQVTIWSIQLSSDCRSMETVEVFWWGWTLMFVFAVSKGFSVLCAFITHNLNPAAGSSIWWTQMDKGWDFSKRQTNRVAVGASRKGSNGCIMWFYLILLNMQSCSATQTLLWMLLVASAGPYVVLQRLWRFKFNNNQPDSRNQNPYQDCNHCK